MYSRMLRQTRRKTITIKAARTFPEQNFASSRSRLLRQTTRMRTEVQTSSLHTLLMFRPPLYFLLQPSNAKGRTDLLVIPPTSLDPNRGRGGMIFNERTFDLGKMLWRGVFVGPRWRCF
jgi:hypothetical protein